MTILFYIAGFTIIWLVLFAIKHETEIHANYTEFLKYKEIQDKEKLIKAIKQKKIKNPTNIAKSRNKNED